jgi:glycosyltransferase involved in cell wall biosynthesis
MVPKGLTASASCMRICLVYDCLFPYTVGGAERWYRNLGERLAADGHEVTYITMRQWERGEQGEVEGVRVVAVGPRMALYTRSGRRRILQALVFGAGVLWHLLREGRGYEVVHTASFPYFSLLAVAAVRPLGRYSLIVDWHEVWSRDYWIEYLGRIGGRIGQAVQTLCVRIPQRAFCFSRLHARRLVESGYRGQPTVLEGEYAGSLDPPEPGPAEALVVFAGRHIPEKRVPAIVPAIASVRAARPDVRCVIFGDGPERTRVNELVRTLGLDDAISAPGFVDASEVERTLRRSACLVLPSRREGYGLIVIEAAAAAVPSVVVEDRDNAAIELVEEGVNGFIARSAAPEDLAGAMIRAIEGGLPLRWSTAEWFARNARRLSMSSSLETVARAYAAGPVRR